MGAEHYTVVATKNQFGQWQFQLAFHGVAMGKPLIGDAAEERLKDMAQMLNLAMEQGRDMERGGKV